MTRARWARAAGLATLAALLMLAGFVLRPALVPESHSAPPVLTPTEIGFAEDMTAHHEQALLMTQRLDAGVDPAIRRLAQQIADTQRLEIGTMLGWLRLANASPTNPHPMNWMHAASTTHDHASMTTGAAESTRMPGMATLAELDALSAARGADAETQFLQLMQRHHRGGVAMAQAVDKLVESGAVKEAARGMISGQSQEAGIMTLLLAQRGVQPLS
ncbi:DUF305 domain-containing protein [Nocardia yamanashiensis]|uniref:DUF305 domain-containing protein n=1 Tax=Nocardia yamanashiensis TaxID=209247 RepID=UPI00082ADCBB